MTQVPSGLNAIADKISLLSHHEDERTVVKPSQDFVQGVVPNDSYGLTTLQTPSFPVWQILCLNILEYHHRRECG